MKKVGVFGCDEGAERGKRSANDNICSAKFGNNGGDETHFLKYENFVSSEKVHKDHNRQS